MSTAIHDDVTSSHDDVTLFRGSSLEDLLPQIRERLGPDAVVLRRRDGLTGGIAGFFRRRCVEVEARAGGPRVDTYDDGGDALELWGGAPDGGGDALEPWGGAPDGGGDALELWGGGAGHGRGSAREVSGGGAGHGRGSAREPWDERRDDGLLAALGIRVGDAATSRDGCREAAAAIDEGLRAPAIRALVASAAPFAEQLARAEARAAAQPVAPEAARRVVEREEPVELAAAITGAVATTAVAVCRPASADALEAALVDGGLSPQLAAEVIDQTVTQLLPFGTPRQLRRLVRRTLAGRIPVRPLQARGEGGAVAFAGSGGAGKTLTVARLARAYAARGDQPVAVVALRPTDGGERLRALLSPLGIVVSTATSAAAARRAIEEAGSGALVLIDTAAVSPADAARVAALASDLARLRAEVQLCIPGTLGASAARLAAEGFAPLRPAGLAITHLDESPLAGAAIGLSMTGGPPLSLLAEGASIDGGIDVADPVTAAALLLR